MKTMKLFLCVALFMALSVPAATAQEMETLSVTEMRNSNQPLVSIRVILRAGSINDPKGKEGLNALTASLIEGGGTKDLIYAQVVEKLYPWAAFIGSQSDHEITSFIGEVHRDHLADFYRLFSGLLLTPRFDSADFQRVKDLAINYLSNTLRSTDDEGLGKQALNVFMFDGHPYGTTEVGTVQGLTSITLDDVKEYYKETYTQANLWVGIAGGYPENFVDGIRADLGKLPEGTHRDVALPPPPPIEGMEVIVVHKPARAYAVSMGYPIALTRRDKDFYALMVANSYFGEHRTFNGVLMNRLRGERGMNYGDYSYIEKFTGGTSGTTFPNTSTPLRQQYFSIWLRPMPPDQTHFGIRNALFELNNLIEKGLTEEQFQATRKFLLNYSKLWAATTSRRLGYRMDSEFYGTEYFIDRIDRELKALTLADVNAAVRKYLNPDNIKIAVVVDEGKGQEFYDALSTNLPSPIVYESAKPADIVEEDKIIAVYPLKVNKAKSRVVHARDLFEK